MPLPNAVLIATDLSIHSDEALRFASRFRPAPFHVVHALDPSDPGDYGMSGAEVTAALAEGTIGPRVTATIERAAERVGEVTVVWRESGDPAATIVDVARKVGADLIIVGTHGRRGVRRLALGSVAEAVLKDAPCPVLVVPFDGKRPWSEHSTRQVLCAVADSPSAQQVVDAAVQIADAVGAQPPGLLHAADGSPAARLRGATERSAEGEDVEALRASLAAQLGPMFNAEGEAGAAILSRADAINADLVVVGTGQRHGVARVLGSVAGRVVRHAPCPVLVVPTPRPSE